MDNNGFSLISTQLIGCNNNLNLYLIRAGGLNNLGINTVNGRLDNNLNFYLIRCGSLGVLGSSLFELFVVSEIGLCTILNYRGNNCRRYNRIGIGRLIRISAGDDYGSIVILEDVRNRGTDLNLLGLFCTCLDCLIGYDLILYRLIGLSGFICLGCLALIFSGCLTDLFELTLVGYSIF